MDIRIGVVGRIVSGDEAGAYVKVIDDASSSGGFLVLTSVNPDMSPAFDGWVVDKDSLFQYFLESSWNIDWDAVKTAKPIQ